MNPETQAKIISTHRHLIASNPSPSQLETRSGTSTVDDSGPPSPSSGVVKNFGEVAPGIYRSSFPYAANLEHLKTLGLKTILTFVGTKNESTEFTDFINDQGIRHLRIEVPAHKKPESVIPIQTIIKILTIMCSPSHYPLLIHCNKGKHRTGCMVACYRKLHGWTDAAIITEYRRYAEAKFRPLDEAFIRSFNAKAASQILNGANVPYVPLSDEEPTSSLAILPTPPPSDKGTDIDEYPDPVGLSPERW